MDNFDEILNKLDKKSLKTIFEYSIEPIIITDANWRKGIKIIYTNRAFNMLTGYRTKELLGKSPKIFQGEDYDINVLRELKKELIKGNHFMGQSINYKKDGNSYIVKWSISPIKDHLDQTIAYISFQKLIDRKVKVEQDKLLSNIVNLSKNLVLVTDLEGVIVYVNDSFSKKLGYKKDELIGNHTRLLKSGMHDNSFYKKMWNEILIKGKFSDIFISKKKDGSFFYDKKDINTIKDEEGEPVFYVSISSDISKQIKKEEFLKKEIYIDSLTTLYNRKKYDLILDEKIKQYKYNNSVFSLILIDIDHFKAINDNYGHDIGDYILKEFAKFVKNNIRSEDYFFRWGGEEFVILVDGDKDVCFSLSQKLRLDIASKMFQSISITVSFGICQFSKKMTKEDLFTKADAALYKAKEDGRNQVVIYD